MVKWFLYAILASFCWSGVVSGIAEGHYFITGLHITSAILMTAWLVKHVIFG